MKNIICPYCGRMFIGWGNKCPYCLKDIRVNSVEVYDKIRDYDSSVRDANGEEGEDETISK